jgi:hypothetical protein
MKKVLFLITVIFLIVILLVPVAAMAADGSSPPALALLPAWGWVLIALAIIVVLILLMFWLLPKILTLAQKNGWNVDGFLAKAGMVIKKADTAVESLIALGMPFNIVDTILDYAAAGVNYAEQLWHTGKLQGEERNAVAKEAIYALLQKAGVPQETIDSKEIDMIIDIGIEAAVATLGHSNKKKVAA